jgi:hypothetical protein
MNNNNREPSLAELRSEAERTRADLTNSAEQLRAKVTDTANDFKTRISPSHIKEEIKDQLRDSRQAWIDTLKKQASDNPLQTIAIGAGLAYPMLGLLRTIPAPIMLVGAGLFLAYQTRNGSPQGANASARASEFAASVQDAAADGVDRLSRAAADVGASADSGVQSMIGKAADIATDGQKAAAELGQALVDTATTAAHSAADTAETLTDNARAFGKTSGKAIAGFAERNPLLVAGAGVAIGAFIAAAVPSSDAENRLFGQGSDALKRQANRSAAAGLRQAKEVADGVAGDVLSAAAQEGLTTEGLAKAARDVTAGVKSVAEKGMQSVLPGEQSAQQKSS